MSKKRVSYGLVLVLLMTVLTACSSKNEGAGATSNETADQPASASASAAPTPKGNPVTLRIMLPGDRPADMDAIIQEAEKRLSSTLNVKLDVTFVSWADIGTKTQITLTSGEDYDLIWDAPSLHLNKMISDGYYEPLDELIQQYGSNIKATRSDSMLEASKVNGKLYGIPLTNASIAPRVYDYRKDLLDKYGMSEIKSWDDMVDFLYKVKANSPDIIPFAPNNDTLGTQSPVNQLMHFDADSFRSANVGGDTSIFYFVNNDGKVHNLLDDMYAPYWDAVKQTRKMYQDGVIYQDILSNVNTGEMFKSGKVAAITTTDFGIKSDTTLALEQIGGEAEQVNFYEGLKPVTNFQAWNFVAVPKASKHKELAIQFLDWANQKDNYDLLSYGIQGKNWEAVGDDKYKVLDNNYPWFPFAWIWNPKLDRLDASHTDEIVKWEKWNADPNNFTADILTGFTFDPSPVANEIAKYNDLYASLIRPILYGIVDPDKNWAKFKTQGAAAVSKIQTEYQSQIDNFLRSKSQ